jgi:ABC-type uncharacterized transport system permease subunit
LAGRSCCSSSARTARHTVEAGPSPFGALGLLIAAFGFFVLLATQRSFDSWHASNPGASRWQVATGPLIVIALGLLVCVTAQILSALRDRDRDRGTRV